MTLPAKKSMAERAAKTWVRPRGNSLLFGARTLPRRFHEGRIWRIAPFTVALHTSSSNMN